MDEYFDFFDRLLEGTKIPGSLYYEYLADLADLDLDEALEWYYMWLKSKY